MWLSILSSLLSFVGPLLEKWLADWLKARLTEHAFALDVQHPVVGGIGFGPAIDPHGAKLALLHRVRDELWVWQFAKRAAVDKVIANIK